MRLLALLVAVLPCLALAQAVKPIRGPVPIPDSNPSDTYRIEKHDRPVQRSHRWQPPVIPHNIKGYQITKDVNTCMVCHSRSAAKQMQATPVARSHYTGRDGKELPTVSTRRYFCLQCHVPQTDAEPLVDNEFRRPR